jgi:iron complex transport system substrate-binding protein
MTLLMATITHWIRLLFLLLISYPFWAAANPIHVTDDIGQTISIAQPARRIVALSPHIVETLFAAGAGSKIVGTVEYSDYPSSAKSIPRIGGYENINLEALVSLKPDLVIGWETGNSPGAIEKIRRLHIPVYLSQSNTVAQIAVEIEKFGQLAGTSATAKPAAEAFRSKLARLTKTYGNRPTVTVFYQISESPLMTIGGKQIITNALSICGGQNIFANLKPMAPVITAEAVLAANPEVIMTSGMDQINPQALDIWKKWPKLTATQRKNLFFIDSDLVNRNGPRIIEGTQILCDAIQIARDRRPSTKP